MEQFEITIASRGPLCDTSGYKNCFCFAYVHCFKNIPYNENDLENTQSTRSGLFKNSTSNNRISTEICFK